MQPASLLIDSHCHLDYDYAPKTVDQLVEEATKAGVGALVTIGVDLAHLPGAVAISEKFPQVYHTVGVHPHEAEGMTDAHLAQLRVAARHPKCRAIGEIGLDYHYDHSPREIQRKRLQDQIELALEVGQPIVIHSRDGEADLLPALAAYAKRVPAGRPVGIIHCFTGTTEFGQACIDLGFYISISGIVTFKNSEELRRSVRTFPLDKLMVETDSPYLAPMPFRGKKCEPAMVEWTARKLAEIHGTTLEEVARLTTANAKRFFRIGG